MDLVDIDQVLDNLELREAADENNKTIASRSIAKISSSLVRNDCCSNGVGVLHCSISAAHAVLPSSSASGAIPPSGNVGPSKSFVGVSQVFNSLDDYRKNVELLETTASRRYDDECKLIEKTTPDGSPTPDSLQVLSRKQPDDADDDEGVDDVQYAIPSNSFTARVTFREDNECRNVDPNNEYSGDGEGDGDDDDDDDDAADVSSDIQKFSEKVRSRYNNTCDNDGDDATTNTNTKSSDSLTTSSSSTFSSGPSPGLASITEDQSTSLSPTKDDSTVDECYRTTPPSAIVLDVAAAIQPDGAAACRDAAGEECERVAVADQENAPALDDLAVSLSSVSINTEISQSDLRRELTVSSAIGGLLDATNTTSLLSKMTDCRKLSMNNEEMENESSCSSPSPSPSFSQKEQHKDDVEGSEFKDEPKKLPPANVRVVCNESMPLRFPSHPVTFGSTMDEISDTELDSMLQEMDIDDVAEDVAAVPRDLGNVKATSGHVEAAPPTKIDVVDHAEEDIASGMDHMNADSFSQASTVEFSEIRGQQPNPTMAASEFGQCSNSVASSYTSSDSSLEGEFTRSRSEEDGDDHNQGRRKRPTTLDLPIMKMNLYANAGQTPPGTNLLQSDLDADSSEELPDSNNDSNNIVSEEEEEERLPSPEIVAAAVNEDENDVVATEGGGPTANVEVDSVVDTDDDVTADQDECDRTGSALVGATGYSDPHANLGVIPPIWVPDNMASACMQCHAKFTMIKRRHHCRACGKVLCSMCCSQKFKLEFLTNPESRVCLQCYFVLTHRQQGQEHAGCTLPGSIANSNDNTVAAYLSPTHVNASNDAATMPPARSPNPNNPMEYCSTIPPHRQVSNKTVNPPSVIVPVGVLKKDGSHSSNSSNSSNKKGRKRKSVMFSDGIAPGSELACMENQWAEAKHARRHQQSDKQRSTGGGGSSSNSAQGQNREDPVGATNGTSQELGASVAATIGKTSSEIISGPSNVKMVTTDGKGLAPTTTASASLRVKRLPPSGCDESGSFIPKEEHHLPPIVVTKDTNSCDFEYRDVSNNMELVEQLQRETIKFALRKNFFVLVKIVDLKCCMNKTVINFTTSGMHQVGNDEIVLLLEYQVSAMKTEPPIPKDIFVHLNEIYMDAEKCQQITELGFTMPQQSNFLNSRDHGGFLYIRASFQCLQDVILPESPFLIGVLIHRYEVPWAKVFPLRLMLRLGAQYRYYPCPHISVRDREPVYGEIAQTIINLLADFRNYSYTLPNIKGMYIHMEDRQTTVRIPRNRHEDVIKAINNSSDHILAFGGNFSKAADGHLVCIQNTNDESAEMYSYSTQAINIQGQPRKVTGASFFVLNEALKSSSGLSGKCSIVEDGLMVQILPSKMEEVRNALKNIKDVDIVCGPVDADVQQTEIVSIKWVENDRDFGVGVQSPIDSMSLQGISGMRVHASFNYSNANYTIKLTEIYMIKCDDWNSRIHTHDITRISEQIARSTSVALLPFLDLLVTNGSTKLGLRVTFHQDIVCYEAGSRSTNLPPLYMNALDDQLIPTLHKESTGIDDDIILELIFYIVNA